MANEVIRLMAPGHTTQYVEPPSTWVGEPIGDLLANYGIDFDKHMVKIDNATIRDKRTKVPAGCDITVSKAVTNG